MSENTDAGIVDIYIDADEVASFDPYGGAGVSTSYTDTGNVVATSGLKTITLKIDGKNGSSSNYFVRLQAIFFYRTA